MTDRYAPRPGARGLRLGLAGFGLWCGLALPARAAPEEIQVYMDEMDPQGGHGLDVHVNTVPRGERVDDYPGEEQSTGRLRVTPEFSYGLTPNLDAGLYLPLATVDRYGHAGLGGVKVRLKFIAPRPETQTWWYGANFEIGHVNRRLDVNPWNAELKGILGGRFGRWTLAANLNLDFVVEGPQGGTPGLDLDTRVGYALHDRWKTILGVENYNNLGTTSGLGRFGQQQQSAFVTADWALPKDWDLHVGVGRGYASNPDHLILKAIVGVPI